MRVRKVEPEIDRPDREAEDWDPPEEGWWGPDQFSLDGIDVG